MLPIRHPFACAEQAQVKGKCLIFMAKNKLPGFFARSNTCVTGSRTDRPPGCDSANPKAPLVGAKTSANLLVRDRQRGPFQVLAAHSRIPTVLVNLYLDSFCNLLLIAGVGSGSLPASTDQPSGGGSRFSGRSIDMRFNQIFGIGVTGLIHLQTLASAFGEAAGQHTSSAPQGH